MGVYLSCLSTYILNVTQNVDPMVVYGVATLGCAGKKTTLFLKRVVDSHVLAIGIGYLLGPVVGSTCWRITHRSTMKLIEARDRQFHQHIVKNRVDPAAQSATNPVPDYYGASNNPTTTSLGISEGYTSGEKIGSLHGYRQVLH